MSEQEQARLLVRPLWGTLLASALESAYRRAQAESSARPIVDRLRATPEAPLLAALVVGDQSVLAVRTPDRSAVDEAIPNDVTEALRRTPQVEAAADNPHLRGTK